MHNQYLAQEIPLCNEANVAVAALQLCRAVLHCTQVYVQSLTCRYSLKCYISLLNLIRNVYGDVRQLSEGVGRGVENIHGEVQHQQLLRL